MFKRLSDLKKSWLVLPAVALLTACSGIPLNQRETKQSELYHQYAGPPIGSFTYLGRYDSWTYIGNYEVVVWTNINDAYLIKVRQPCTELPFTQHIGLTQTAHTVSQKFDFVLVGRDRCWIDTIQPVNYLQMKRDMRQKTADAKAAAEAAKQEEQKQ
jgi:Family of unknown function (DUF6491)